MTDPSVLPYVWMLSGCFFFTLMGAMTHALGPNCDWRLIALARSSLALLFASGLAMHAGVRLIFFGPRTLWIRSLAGSVSLVSTFFALTRLPISDVLALTNMFPIWVALLSWPLLHEPPGGEVLLAVCSGVSGVALIQQPHFAQGNFAILLALFSSFFTAIAMLGLHRLSDLDPRCIVVHFSGVSSLVCLLALFLGWNSVTLEIPTFQSWWLLLGVGFTATVGQLFLTRAFAEGSPAKVSVVGLTQVVMAIVLDRVLFGRSFSVMTILGMALVLLPTGWLMIQQAWREEIPVTPPPASDTPATLPAEATRSGR